MKEIIKFVFSGIFYIFLIFLFINFLIAFTVSKDQKKDIEKYIYFNLAIIAIFGTLIILLFY
jgi:hypothetical protein